MLLSRFLIYGLVQVAAYGIDLGTFLLLSERLHLQPIVANAIGKILACVFAFLVHRRITFASNGEIISEAFRYTLLALFNTGVGSVVLYATMYLFADAVVSKIVADVILVLVSFSLSKMFVFVREASK